MSDGSIAIVGAACRFPGAPGLDAFWDLLVTGVDAISQVGEDRWSTRFYYHPTPGEPGKSYTWSAGLISGIDQFEPAFFGISPREAAQMDPQQRILLELVWHAAEDAGITSSRFAGSETGVYVGASSTDYRDLRLGDPASGDSYFMTGGTLSILPNRISHVFDLRGPSLAVDTACSSSLVALHHACEAIRGGRIGAAIVGGINLLLAPYPFLGFCRASMLSRRGRCFAFDERADGYVRAEGGGVLILKPLAQACADGDRIRAVILGTGVNSDGHTIGLSLPSELAQAKLIGAVCEQAGVIPEALAFFEMHGTGTPAGDPIEAAAVGRVLGRARSAPLPIGSVKTNIGHLEPASGIAGLIKTALALEHGVIPPTLNCERPNPAIPFSELNLRLVREAEQIGPEGCAGVNSFGFGGTNANVVVAAAPATPVAAEPSPRDLPPLVISARSRDALRQLAREWSRLAATAPRQELPRLFRGAARKRDQHAERLVAFGGAPAEMAAQLAEFAADGEGSAVVTGTAIRDGKLAFVFSGNGAQFEEMGREAYRGSRAFRKAVERADKALAPGLGWSVAAMIERGVSADELAHADIAQPLLFAIQVGIVSALRDLGVVATGHVGHSVGEIAAAWSAGALSLADAARVVVARSRAQEMTRGRGRMAALALGERAATELLSEIGSPLEIGAVNASQSVTISGPEEAIQRLALEARRRGIACRVLDLDFAFHSAAMDPIRDGLVTDLEGLRSRRPKDVLASAVTGERVTTRLLDAEYWWRNIRNPVRFTEAMSVLVEDGFRIFLEIGPNPVLQSYLHDALRRAEQPGRALATLSRKDDDREPFAAIAARCHVAGYDFTGAARFDGPVSLAGLPLYPWQRERFWFDRTTEATNPVNPAFDHPLLGFRQDGPLWHWLVQLDPTNMPWLADHAIEGVPVLPGAAVVEMALAAARARRPDASTLELLDVELRRPLPFNNGRSREIRNVLVGEDGDWELSSRARLADEPATLHAVGRIIAAGEYRPSPPPAPLQHAPERVDAADLYRIAAEFGLDYGRHFRTITRIERFGASEVIAHLEPAVAGERDGYLIHPALLDGAMQAMLALIASRQAGIAGCSFLPWRFGRVRAVAPYGRECRTARVRMTRLGTRSASADIVLIDSVGAVIAELTDCWFRRVELTRANGSNGSELRVELVPAPLDDPAAPPILETFGDVATRLARALPDDASRTEQSLLTDALVASVARQAVLRVTSADTDFSIDELVAAGAVSPTSVPLFEYLLVLLLRFGAAAETDGVWRISDQSELPEIAAVWRLLLAESPDLVAELALIAAAAEELPGILVEGPRSLEAMPSAMIEHLLLGSPASKIGGEFVRRALAEIAERWPPGQSLRILEVGADASATRRVVDDLLRAGVAIDYLATHPDADQAARVGFALAGIAGAGASHWSPGQADALDDRRFDIVLLLHCCARLQIDGAGLRQLRELLAPGGLLLAIEPAPNPLWDMVFGQYPGWWPSGVGQSPLRSGPEWQDAAAAAGFLDTGHAGLAAGPWPSAVFWGRAPSGIVPAASAPIGSVCVDLIGTGPEHPADLQRELAAAGWPVRKLNLDAFAEPDMSADAAGRIALAVIGEGGEPVPETARLLPLLSRAASIAAERQIPLWVVTSGAQQETAGGNSAIIGGAVWGFARTLLNEMPRLQLRLLDLAPTMSAAQRAAIIIREVAAASPETEVVWSDTGRCVLRLRRGLPPRFSDPQDPVVLTSDGGSGIDALGWRPLSVRQPGPGEVTVQIHAAGLNFRDVMWAMGLLPEEALIDGFAGPTFGLECAGVVTAIGAGVGDLAVGDRVAGFAPAALGSHVTTAAHALTRIPLDLDFAAAATIPVTFVTAIYALGTLGNLAPGELVLVHGGAGGVGLAAIQYAKYRGASVIATSGSPLKRAFLRLAGADHVLDSRDLGFADAVREFSGGAGVDVVLNSLSGEAMEQSLALLKPFGRFLELGKRDFYLNRRIHLRPLRQNISYFAIDVDQLPMQRPDLARGLLAEIATALAEGAIRPLGHRSFAFADADDAFRLMQASGHIGKLVLTPSDSAGVRLRHTPELSLRRDGTYLVTGGTSGFGFAAARWLAQRGAGALALVSRRGAQTPGIAERAAELEALGAEVRVFACDVADQDALAAALDEIRASDRPLRGVVHAASAIADSLATELDAARVVALLRAKLGGAVALDQLTRSDPIDLFVLFSSATTLLGAPGQGVYVAANSGLEALARRRHAEGRPALSVAWGPIEDAGYLAERTETREALARRLGARPVRAAQALGGLPAMIASGLPVVASAETDWNDARRVLPTLAAPMFCELRADAGGAPVDDSLMERLAGLDKEEASALLRTIVAEEAANILRLPASGLDPLRPLSEIGMDSLMAVELRLALENRLRIDLPLMSLAEGTSVASIAGRLANAMMSRSQASDVISLAERYEVADPDRLAAVASAAGRYQSIDIKTEAAE